MTMIRGGAEGVKNRVAIQIFPTNRAESPIYPGESRGAMVIGSGEIPASQFNFLDLQMVQHFPEP
jgi:hypothetical protein